MTDVRPLTDTDYWNQIWAKRVVPSPLLPAAPGLNGAVNRALHRFLSQAMTRIGVMPQHRVLEAGCGGSVILPYLVQQFSVVAEGIDYSEEGCELSRAIAARSGVETTIHQCDMFNPPDHLLGRYDVVFSAGLVEHFDPTSRAITALQRLLASGGHLITLVPNMTALPGLLQYIASPKIYAGHVALDLSRLAQAHQSVDMQILDAGYLMTVNFGAINFTDASRSFAHRFGPRLSSWASKAVWMMQAAGLPEMPNGWTSPYVFVIARKPG